MESDAGCHLGVVAGHVLATPIPIPLTVSPARGRAAGKLGAPGSSRRGARGGPTSPRSAAAHLPSVTWGGLGPMGTVGGEGALACAPLQPPRVRAPRDPGTLGARPVLPSLVRLRASGTLRDFVQHGSRALESTRPFNRARGPPPGTKLTEGDVIVVPAPSLCLSLPPVACLRVVGFARHLGVVSVPRHEGAGEGPGWRLSGAAFLAPRSFSTCLSQDGSPVLGQLGRLVALGPHGLRPLFSRTQGSTRSLPLGPIRESSPRGTVRDSRPLDPGPLVPSAAGASGRHVLFQASECVLAARRVLEMPCGAGEALRRGYKPLEVCTFHRESPNS